MLTNREEEFIRVTALNTHKGICGFAAAYCYLYDRDMDSFHQLLANENSECSSNLTYRALVKALNGMFEGHRHFPIFIASNMTRWMKNNNNLISEIREFSIRWPRNGPNPIPNYELNLATSDGMLDFLTKVGIPLTPNCIIDLVHHYSKVELKEIPSSLVPDYYAKLDRVPFVTTFYPEPAILGLTNKNPMGVSIEHTLLHKFLLHWVFLRNDRIYDSGNIIGTHDIEQIQTKTYPVVSHFLTSHF